MPVDLFRLEVEMVNDTNEEILKVNKGAQTPEVKEFKVEFGDVTLTEGAPTDEAAAAQLREGIK